MHGGLGRSPRQAVGAGGVLPVLDDVEIETAQFDHAEMMHFLIDRQEIVFVVLLDHLGPQSFGAAHDPVIERDHPRGIDQVVVRMKAVQIGKHETRGIADAPVGVGDLAENLLGNRHFAAIIGGGDPQPQNIGAVLVKDPVRGHGVAERFRHLAPFGVDEEAVGQHFPVGSAAVHGDGGLERGLEPAPVLIRAFQVEVGRITQLFAPVKHGKMRNAGIEPDVEGIGDLVVVFGVVAEQFPGIEFVPGVDTALLHPPGDLFEQLLRVGMQFAGFPVHEQGDRHAPGALPGNAPVRAAAQHQFHPRLAPAGNPLDSVHRLKGRIEQSAFLHADEPLRRCAIDQCGLRAPAMRVTVRDAVLADEFAVLLQHFDYVGVDLVDVGAGEASRRFTEDAVIVDQIERLQAVLAAGVEIVDAMIGRGMHRPGSAFGRDMPAEHDGHFALVQRVAQALRLQPRTLAYGKRFEALAAVSLHDFRGHLPGDHEQFRAGVEFAADQGVIEPGMEADRLVRRQGPGRGGPDHDGDRQFAIRLPYTFKTGQQGGAVGRGEAHIDRIRSLVLEFDFGLGQGRCPHDAPVHRFIAAHEMTVGDDSRQGAHDVGLGLEVHGEIGVLPISEHSHANEACLLYFDLAGGVFAAGAAEFGMADLLPRLAFFLFDIVLDRQTVAVPAGNIGRVETRHCPRLDDDVLERLVNGVTEMQLAVGVGRTVVQNKARTSRVLFADGAIQVEFPPFAQARWLAVREVGPHGEIRMRKIQAVLVLAHDYSFGSLPKMPRLPSIF